MDAVNGNAGCAHVAVRVTSPTMIHRVTSDYRKRKRGTDEHIASSAVFHANIVSTAAASPDVSFSIVSTILRAHLPLSWLGTRSTSNTLPPGVVLEATISSVQRWDYRVLVARHLPNGALYAMESVEEDILICHPLQAWVTTEWVRQAAIGATPMVDADLLIRPEAIQSHHRHVSTSSISSLQQLPTASPSPKQPKNRRGILARKSILEKEKQLESPGTEDASQVDLIYVLKQGSLSEEKVTRESGPKEQTPSNQSNLFTEEITTKMKPTAPTHFESVYDDSQLAEMHPEHTEIDQLSPEYLRRRYLETLYLCKTTLAFYAKGPLSRTRARLRIAGSSMSFEQLANHYRDTILPTKKMDLKYKESIKNKIMSLPPQRSAESNGEGARTLPAKKTKKLKTLRLGRDALWPIEEELIEQWWRKRDYKKDSGTSANVQAAELSDAMKQLRMRETELQIILILEVMALEAKDRPAMQLQADDVEAVTAIEFVNSYTADLTSKTTKLKKKRDLKAELEGLLDRLCIWHTVGLDEYDLLSGQTPMAGQSTSASMKDRLRDFCKDVIVPFYGGKLPEQCKIICKKLGGPEISPQRSNPRTTAPSLPGAVIATRKPLTTKRTLERVLSEDQGVRSFSPPAFSRSSTLPLAPSLKREPSDRPISRSFRHKSISFSNREVDLVADANITAAKRRKLDVIAAQKRELDAAIEALKKPNRTMLAKDFMNDLESRTVDRRVPAKRVEPIQISATPRHGRIRPDEDDLYDLPPLPLTMSRHHEPVIPSSTTKQHGTQHFLPMSVYSSKKKAVLSAISDKPQRPRLQHWSSAGSADQGYFETRATGGQSKSTVVTSTPAFDRRRTDLDDANMLTPLPMYKVHTTVSSTPNQALQMSTQITFKDIPQIPQAAGKAMDRVMTKGTDILHQDSIYDTLGWNDDSDI